MTDRQSWLSRAIGAVETRLSDVLMSPPAQPGCIPATTTERATPESLPVDTGTSTPTPEQINPGLASGLNVSPQSVGLPGGPTTGNKARGKIVNG
jgi:hypothetical protein